MDSNELGVRAVDHEHPRYRLQVRAKSLVSGETDRTRAIAREKRDRRALPHPGLSSRTGCHNDSDRFVAERERQVRPIRLSPEDVKVGAADAARFNPEHDVIVMLRNGDRPGVQLKGRRGQVCQDCG
jgi:hypothetical protein